MGQCEVNVCGDTRFPLRVWNASLPHREFLDRRRVKPSAGDPRTTTAIWNLFRVVASAVSEGIASIAVTQWASIGRSDPTCCGRSPEPDEAAAVVQMLPFGAPDTTLHRAARGFLKISLPDCVGRELWVIPERFIPLARSTAERGGARRQQAPVVAMERVRTAAWSPH